jgi:hypothetical protein
MVSPWFLQRLDRRASFAMTSKKAHLRHREERSDVAIPPQNLSS